jgi:hypothetical protein
MADAAASRDEFDFGAVISRTGGVIGRNFWTFAGLSFLLAGLPAAAMGGLAYYYGYAAASNGQSIVEITTWLTVASLGVFLVSMSVLQGALIHSAVSDLSGRKVSFGASLAVGMRYFLPLIALAILSSIGVGLGLLLFIIPGLILAVMWSVVTPALVVDRTGVMGSFERSAWLSKGHRWSIFGLLLLYGIATLILSFAFAVPGQLLSTSSITGGVIYVAVLSPIETTISSMIGAAGVAALYVELRKAKEGVGVESIADVFA